MAGLKEQTVNDYQVWDDTETVTVFPPPRNELIFFPVSGVFRRAPTYKEMTASGGAYTSQDLVFLIPAPTSQKVDGHFPFRPGAIVKDGRLVSWTVLEASPIAWENVWRVTARNLVLAFGLADEIKILRPKVAKGSGGEPVYTWGADATVIAADLPARVQIQAVEPNETNELQTPNERFVVVLGQQVDLQVTDRIVVTKGARKGIALMWTAVRNADRIDMLSELDCLRV